MSAESHRHSNPYPCGRISRRGFLHQAGVGFFGSAMGALWAADGKLAMAGPQPHFPAKARSVIFLFMCGGVSHIDTFDPKDNKWAGTLIDAVGFGDNLAEMRRPVIPCHRSFTRYGQSGIPVSDWFPHVGGVIDDIAVVRSMYCHETNHFPAVIEMATGHRDRVVEHPCLGSWISYALGTENQNLPAFVNMGRPSSPLQLSGGYLGASVAATPFQPGDTPIPNLRPPKGLSPAEREKQLQALAELNRAFREEYAIHSTIAARTKAYELAARMQLSAPEAVDFRGESDAVKALYGIDGTDTEDFGKQLLLSRHLVERGVRFIQICHAGGGNGSWDAHGDIKSHGPALSPDRQADRGADPGSQAARPAGQHPGGMDQRVRAHALVPEHHGTRPQPARLHLMDGWGRSPRRDGAWQHGRGGIPRGRVSPLHRRSPGHHPAADGVGPP